MIKKLSICIYKIFTIAKQHYEPIKKNIIKITRIIMKDLPKKLTPEKVISYFSQQKQGKCWDNFCDNDLLFHTSFTVIFGLLITGIIEIAKFDFIPKYIAPQPGFLVFSFLFTLAVMVFLLFLKLKKTKKKNEEFKNINELTNLSYYTVFDFFIRSMRSLKEAKDLTTINEILKEYNEQNLFTILAKALSNFLENLFPAEFNTKIDIFKFNGDKLIPIMDTLINGAFIKGQRSSEFTITHKNICFESLADFTFSRNKIGYIQDVNNKLIAWESLTDNELKMKLQDEETLYFKKDEEVESFNLNTLLCLPLIHNVTKWGVLSISFKERDIETYLESTGITIEDFKKCISLFIKKYTKFVMATSEGINKLLQLSNLAISSNTHT